MTNSSYLTLATPDVDENGFMYTKGKSRSKAFGSEAGGGDCRFESDQR